MAEKLSQPVSAAPADPAKFQPYPLASTSDSLPLLVRMPNGERHQVDVPPTASVKDLKMSIASQSSTLGFPFGDQDQTWDLGFGGATLNDNQSLSHYNIPDAYDHANGLLKTISDSGYGDPDKKVEALDKACAVVAGISRGEKDMERLINAVLDEVNDPTPESPTTQQPTLADLKRSRRSRIPPLNFGSLTPVDPLPITGKENDKAENPLAPPTPSQLIRKLSGVRPDLYDPSAAERATTSSGQPGSTSSRIGLFRSSGANDAAQQSGSGELKRGVTWVTDYLPYLDNPMSKSSKPDYDGDGNSEGEHENSDPDGDSEEGDEPAPAKDSVPEPLKSEDTSEKVEKEEPITTNADAAQSTGRDSQVEATKEMDEQERLKEASPRLKSIANGKGTSTAASAPLGNCTNKAAVPSSSGAQKQVIGLGPDAGPTEDVKLPKKRGRKRKNPHLSEEERKAQRQAQNRESAKQSRIRRKHMTMEYERRVHTLEGENENLRDTVAALTDRLEMLQNLLTVSVQKRPMPHLHAAPQDGMAGLAHLGAPTLNVQPPLTGQGALSAPGALNAHFTSPPQYPPVSQTGSQGIPGASGIPQSTAPQSNHLTNLGFKNI